MRKGVSFATSLSLHLVSTRPSVNLKKPAAAADDGRAVFFTLQIVSSPQSVRGEMSLSKSQIKTQISREHASGLETEQATVTDTLSLKMMH